MTSGNDDLDPAYYYVFIYLCLFDLLVNGFHPLPLNVTFFDFGDILGTFIMITLLKCKAISSMASS